jgi:hypothetical protein
VTRGCPDLPYDLGGSSFTSVYILEPLTSPESLGFLRAVMTQV